MTQQTGSKRRSRWFWPALGLFTAAVILIAGLIPFMRYSASRRAAKSSLWLAASEVYCRLCESRIGYTYTDSCYRCARAVHQAIVGIPYANLSAERRLLDRLATIDPAALPAAFDQSRVSIPAGDYTLGSLGGRDDERPPHTVHLSAFAIDRYEVTNAQYVRFVAAVGRKPPRYWPGQSYPPGLAAAPVVGVSWQDAHNYCAWARGRLPTEAEWEAACRGADGQIYPWGDDWQATFANTTEACLVPGGNYLEALWPLLATAPSPGQAGLRPVGSFPHGASAYGVLDLAGNASEWVADWYNPRAYQELPAEDLLSPGPTWNHVVRGGSWWVFPVNQGTASFENRCAARNGSHSADDPRLGFRCAKDSPNDR